MTLIIAILCLSAYVFALGWGAYRIFNNIKSNRTRAESNFYALREILSGHDARAFHAPGYRQDAQEALTDFPPLMGAIISGPGDDYAFEREGSSVINWVDGTPRFARRFGVAREPLFTPLQIDGLRNINLYAVYNYLDYDDFLHTLRRSLLMVLGALGVAFLCLILETALEKQNIPPAGAPPPPEGGSPPSTKDILDSPEDAETGEEEAHEEEHGGHDDHHDHDDHEHLDEHDLHNEHDDHDAHDEHDHHDEHDDHEAGGEHAEDGHVADFSFDDDASVAAAREAAPVPPPKPAPRPAASGPDRNAKILERLGTELENAAIYEADLSVMVVRYGNPDDPDGIWYADFVRMASDAYRPRDLIFEHGKHSLLVIIPNADLEKAIERAQDFRKILPSTFTQSLAMGISARAGREVLPDRLLLEALHAAKRAGEDPAAPIVAFKSDPEKFRAFIEDRQAPPRRP